MGGQVAVRARYREEPRRERAVERPDTFFAQDHLKAVQHARVLDRSGTSRGYALCGEARLHRVLRATEGRQ